MYYTRLSKTDAKPVHVKPKPGEIKHSCASIKRAEKILGYKPVFTIDKGLERLVKWYTSKPAQSSKQKRKRSW